MGTRRARWWVTIGLFAALGVALAGIVANWQLDDALASQPLTQTEGLVVVSEVKVRANRQKEAVIVVAYAVDGRSFKASNDMFGIVGDDRMGASALADRYSKGASASVWYVPGEPSNAYLEPPAPASTWKYVVGLVAAGLLTVVFARLRWIAHRRTN